MIGGGVGEGVAVDGGVLLGEASGEAEVPGSGVGVSAGCAKGVGLVAGVGGVCARAKSTPAKAMHVHNAPSSSLRPSKTQAIFAVSAIDTAVASSVL